MNLTNPSSPHSFQIHTDTLNHYVASSSSFITVTVSTILGSQEPGDEDQSIPLLLGGLLSGRADRFSLYSTNRRVIMQRSSQFYGKAMNMASGREGGPWWQQTPVSPDDDTSYECDAGLGAPREVDCSQLQYSQLGGGSTDQVMIGPGTSKVITSGKINCEQAPSSAFTFF